MLAYVNASVLSVHSIFFYNDEGNDLVFVWTSHTKCGSPDYVIVQIPNVGEFPC